MLQRPRYPAVLLFAASAALLGLGSGCGRSSQTTVSSDSTATELPPGSPPAETEVGRAGGADTSKPLPISTAGGPSEVLNEVRTHEFEIDRALQSSTLTQVRGHAEAIGALLAAVGTKTQDIEESRRSQLAPALATAQQGVRAVGEAADRNDLASARAAFAGLRDSLRAIERILAVTAP